MQEREYAYKHELQEFVQQVCTTILGMFFEKKNSGKPFQEATQFSRYVFRNLHSGMARIPRQFWVLRMGYVVILLLHFILLKK